jgi:hypothetical protein
MKAARTGVKAVMLSEKAINWGECWLSKLCYLRKYSL